MDLYYVLKRSDANLYTHPPRWNALTFDDILSDETCVDLLSNMFIKNMFPNEEHEIFIEKLEDRKYYPEERDKEIDLKVDCYKLATITFKNVPNYEEDGEKLLWIDMDSSKDFIEEYRPRSSLYFSKQ